MLQSSELKENQWRALERFNFSSQDSLLSLTCVRTATENVTLFCQFCERQDQTAETFLPCTHINIYPRLFCAKLFSLFIQTRLN